MRDSRLLLLAATGLLILSAGSQDRPGREKLDDIGPERIGKKVTVSGEVETYRTYNSSSFINISEGKETVTVIDFNSVKAFSPGENISVTGKVSLYHGKIEIIAEEVSRKTSG